MCGYDSLPGAMLLSHVLPHICASDRVVLSRVNRRTRELILGDAGVGGQLRMQDFVSSVARFQWARKNSCP